MSTTPTTPTVEEVPQNAPAGTHQLTKAAAPPHHHCKPEIHISGRRTYEITGEVLPKLVKATTDNPYIFIRSGKLCRFLTYRDEKNIEPPKIEPFSLDSLSGVLDREADWFVITKAGEILTSPPLKVVKDILSLGEWPFPGITGIVEMPVMRGDGTILSTPGYDPHTGLYYWAPADFTPLAIPDAPTQGQVQKARGLLEEVICDFPFVEGRAWRIHLR